MMNYRKTSLSDDAIAQDLGLDGNSSMRIRSYSPQSDSNVGKTLGAGYREHTFTYPETNEQLRVSRVFIDTTDNKIKGVNLSNASNSIKIAYEGMDFEDIINAYKRDVGEAKADAMRRAMTGASSGVNGNTNQNANSNLNDRIAW